jgi:dihydropyrimidine dehydrogenase (NAD+) subunit PreA
MKEGRVFEVIDAECVACNLCVNVCPVENCISMVPMATGATDPRTGRVVTDEYANWTTHPNNPSAKAAE